MIISIKKTASISIFVTGMAGALTLQAHEVCNHENQGTKADDRAALPMDMQRIMGMSGQMREMMLVEN